MAEMKVACGRRRQAAPVPARIQISSGAFFCVERLAASHFRRVRPVFDAVLVMGLDASHAAAADRGAFLRK